MRMLAIAFAGLLLAGCHSNENVAVTKAINSATPNKPSTTDVKQAEGLYHGIKQSIPLTPAQRDLLNTYEKGDAKLRGVYAEILRKSFETGAMPKEEAMAKSEEMLRNDSELHQLWQQIVDRMKKKMKETA